MTPRRGRSSVPSVLLTSNFLSLAVRTAIALRIWIRAGLRGHRSSLMRIMGWSIWRITWSTSTTNLGRSRTQYRGILNHTSGFHLNSRELLTATSTSPLASLAVGQPHNFSLRSKKSMKQPMELYQAQATRGERVASEERRAAHQRIISQRWTIHLPTSIWMRVEWRIRPPSAIINPGCKSWESLAPSKGSRPWEMRILTKVLRWHLKSPSPRNRTLAHSFFKVLRALNRTYLR